MVKQTEVAKDVSRETKKENLLYDACIIFKWIKTSREEADLSPDANEVINQWLYSFEMDLII